jgi:hypothetical protein
MFLAGFRVHLSAHLLNYPPPHFRRLVAVIPTEITRPVTWAAIFCSAFNHNPFQYHVAAKCTASHVLYTSDKPTRLHCAEHQSTWPLSRASEAIFMPRTEIMPTCIVKSCLFSVNKYIKLENPLYIHTVFMQCSIYTFARGESPTQTLKNILACEPTV